MKREGLSALSAQQRECLRLVAQHQSSKDIAKVLGTSPHTVDNHIRAAIQRLGVTSRREASRLFMQSEQSDSRRKLTSQSSVIAETPSRPSTLFPPPDEVRFEPGYAASVPHVAGEGVRQAAVGAQGMIRLPLPRFVGDENDLSARRRVIWVFVLMITAWLGLGGALAALELLNRLL